MQSKAADFDANVAEAPAAQQEALAGLRDVCGANLIGRDEMMRSMLGDAIHATGVVC